MGWGNHANEYPTNPARCPPRNFYRPPANGDTNSEMYIYNARRSKQTPCFEKFLQEIYDTLQTEILYNCLRGKKKEIPCIWVPITRIVTTDVLDIQTIMKGWEGIKEQAIKALSLISLVKNRDTI